MLPGAGYRRNESRLSMVKRRPAMFRNPLTELRMRHPALIATALLAACGGDGARSSASCGIAAMASPNSVIAQFGIPRQTLSRPPAALPERLVARVAGGGAFPAIVGRSSGLDSLLLIGVEGGASANMALGFGVLLTTTAGESRGVMLFEGLPVEAAPHICTVSMGAVSAPLLGLEADPAAYEDPGCPLFPDSTLQ